MADKDRRRAVEAHWKEAGGYDVAPTAAKYYEDALRAGTDIATSKWTHDQYQLRRAFAEKDSGNIESRSIVGGYFDNWMESIESNQNVATAPSSSAITMTPFEKVKGTYYVTEGSNIKVWGKDAEALDWKYKANMKATGSGRMVFLEEGGTRMPYVEVDVEFAVPLDKNGKILDTGIENFAKNNDFTSTAVTQYSQFDISGIGETKKFDAQVYNGTVLVPASFTYENMVKVDSNVGFSIEEERYLRKQGMYHDYEMIDKLAAQTPGTNWRMKDDGDYVSVDGKYLYKRDENQFYEIK
jgi:hypothetical protein